MGNITASNRALPNLPSFTSITIYRLNQGHQLLWHIPGSVSDRGHTDNKENQKTVFCCHLLFHPNLCLAILTILLTHPWACPLPSIHINFCRLSVRPKLCKIDQKKNCKMLMDQGGSLFIKITPKSVKMCCKVTQTHRVCVILCPV